MYTFILLVSIAGLSISNAQSAGYQLTALDCHNNHRQCNSAPALVMDPNMNTVAAECAKYYASINAIDHSCPDKNGYGENLACGSNTIEDITTAAINMWYDEWQNYNFNNPGFSSACGHFSQLVWKGSTSLGFGCADDGQGNTYVVALYSSPGNSGGPDDYRANVLPSTCS